MLIFICIIAVIFVILGLRDFWEKWEKKTSHPASLPVGKERMNAMKALVDRKLHELNCQPKWQVDDESANADYDYQNGHFRIHIDTKALSVKLNYLFFYTTSYENLNQVRSLCNDTNLRTDQLKVVYSVNETENEVNLHFLSSLMLEEANATAVLTETMADAFVWQNAFVKKFEQDLSESKTRKTKDLEDVRYDYNRKLFLARQQEAVRHGSNELRATPNQPLAIGTLLEKTLGLNDITPLTLTLYYGDKAEQYNGDILQYNLADAATIQQVNEQRVLMSLTFTASEAPGVEQWASILINDEGDDKMTHWFRATISMVRQNGNEKFPHGGVLYQTVLLAHDKTTDRQRLAEFDYMWKDAKEKMAKGEADALTEEQRLICSVDDMKSAELLYWGNKYFLQGRYYEALLYLEHAYCPMQARYTQLSNKERDVFFEACFLIGFCYTELKQYEKACYYLDVVHQLHMVRYSIEYVNAMVNGGDFRALFKIDEILNGIAESRQRDPDGQTSEQQENLDAFIAFLLRRKAYVLIEQRMLEPAKKLLTEMLDNPACHDFAISELAYIEKLEKQE